MSRQTTTCCLALLAFLTAGAALAQSQVQERGFKPDAVYQFNGFDTVNVFNGNLILNLPLGVTYPVSAGLSYSFTLRYAGQFWSEVEFCSVGANRDEVCRLRHVLERDNAGVGWRIAFGELYRPLDTSNPYSPTGMWKYVSPDGSTHNFFPTLHDPVCGENGVTSNCDTADTTYRYTRDGTYLRLKLIDSAQALLEFPDGLKQRFIFENGEWRLQYMYTPFSTLDAQGDPTTNYMKIDVDPITRDWTVTDSRNRTHHVHMEAVPSTDRYVITSLDLAAFGGTTAHYTLNQSFVELSQPCDTDTKKEVALLSSLDLPSGESFSFSYQQPPACSDFSGVLTSATFPTGGSIDWSYQTSAFAGEGNAVAVSTKTIKDAEGTAVGKTTYTITSGKTVVDSYAAGTDPYPDTRSVNYFQIDRATVDNAALYGLPFTFGAVTGLTNPDSAGRYVSSITYDCAPATGCPATPVSAEKVRYVRYERDQRTTCTSPNVWCQREGDRRVVSERTVYPTDGSVDSGTTYSRFDGLGHFRIETSFGSFDSLTLEKFTNFNKDAGSLTAGVRDSGYVGIPAGNKWLLNTYVDGYALQGMTYARYEACFDSATGFLKRRRAQAGNTAAGNDVVTVFTPDTATGYVAREKYYGGDLDPAPTGGTLCALSLSGETPQYEIEHLYDFAAVPNTEKSRYVDGAGTALSFFTSDLAIDKNTGLISASTDTAGLTTTFTYDTSGRVTATSPPGGEASTSYTYVNVSSTGPASVTASTSSSSSQISRTYEYDYLGRVAKEKRLLFDGTWSTREMRYDGLGRKTAVSEEETAPSHWTYFSNFDASSRPRVIDAPDQKRTTIEYTGDRFVKRTTTVATSTAESNVAVKEQYDRAGRLAAITEDADGAASVTTYSYDPANHLSKVTMGVQERTFEYDGRGFLTSETHPESGVTSYQYDARGHMTWKKTPLTTLTYTYDRAERPLTVEQDTALLKSFTYDRENAGTDYAMGKLASATRYNDAGPLGTISVTETYTYAAIGGRLSNKTTAVSPGPTFSDSYSYNNLGLLASVTYPACSACAMSSAPPARSVSNVYTRGALTTVANYATGITYHPNGMVATIPHRNAGNLGGPIDEQTIANGMARPNSLSVRNYCDGTLTITQQPQSRSVSTNSPAGLSVTASGATSYQWFKKDGTKLTGQTGSTLTLAVTQTETYFVRVYRTVTGSNCSVDSEPATVTVTACPTPDTTISAPASVAAWAAASASVTSTAGASYDWSVTNGMIISGTGTSSISFRADCSGPLVLTVAVTSSCGASATSSRNVTVNVPTATVSGSATIDQGENTTIRATLTGTGPWTIIWSDGTTQSNITSSPATRSVSPSRTTTYTITSFYDANCAGTDSGQAAVTVTPPTPAPVVATATSATSVSIQWSSSGTIDRFEVYRDGVKIASPVASPYTDSVGAGTAHVYYVVAVTAGTPSAPSSRDLATAVMFSETVAPGVLFSAQHIAELRTAVNAVRAAGGLPAAVFTDNPFIRTYHITELRTALDGARNALQLTPVSYSRPTLSAGASKILATDLNELRGGVQ